MPIRIRKDKNTSSSKQSRIPNPSRRRGGGGGFPGGGGGGIIASLLPMAINLFKKNPKIGIVVIIGAIIIFFMMGGFGGTGGGSFSNQSLFGSATGLEMDEEVYDQAEVFAPLADNTKNPLPEKVSLEKYCPSRKNQGKQGSCVGWASAYGARTILHARQTGKSPNSLKFSPSYLYNQIHLDNCQGSYLQKAMETMKSGGVAPYSEFAYNENNCSKMPSKAVKQHAKQFKTKGFNRLSLDGNDYKTDLLAMKQNLAQGAPVVIGMMVGGSFMGKMRGKKLWKPTKADYNNVNSFGGHALCVIGYDDNYAGGAFQIMNSWGEDWGARGFFWIRYNDFEYFNREAYGLYPMGSSEKFDKTKMSASIGLVYNKSAKNIELEYTGGITFKTKKPIKLDTDFKVEVTNSIECYVYVFGEETDGSNYVLFPYTQKHSPYCGITGTRVFPNGYSMYADNLGTTDRMAVIVSKQPLDYNKVSTAINNAHGLTYEQKVTNALKNELVTDITFKGGKTFKFTSNITTKNTVAVIIEIDKN